MPASRHYLRLLDRIHTHLLPRTYLEIGVNKGKSLALALPCTEAIGVDPDPRIRYAIDPRAHVAEMTSDAFFRDAIDSTVLRDRAVDLSFLDGMHEFAFTLRDFINVERVSAPGSAVLIHDVYPHTEAEAAGNAETGHWAGDVWKLMFVLAEHRPDLTVRTVDVPPTGLGVITGLDPSSTVLSDGYDEIVARHAPQPYEVFRAEAGRRLNVMTDDWATLMPGLPPPYQRGDRARLRLRRTLRTPPRLVDIAGEVERRVGLTPLGDPLRRLKGRLRGALR